MKLWKRNAVVAAIVLFVCVAVYLNWSYAQADPGDSASVGGSKTLGEAALVSGQDAATGELLLGQQEPSGQEQAVGGQEGESGDSYFSSARLTRQQARDSALSILQETVSNTEATQDARDSAAASISAMATCTVTEAQIENLVTAKGYADCVTFIGDNSISVVVSAQEGGLTSTDVAKITDIVMGETDFTANQIKIIEAD